MAGNKYVRFEPEVESKYIRFEDQDVPLSRRAEAALEGFGEGATSGYLSDIQGKIAGLIDPAKEVNEELRKSGFSVSDPGESAQESRDYFVRRGRKLREESPGAYTGGLVGGAISSAPIYGSAGKAALGIVSPAARTVAPSLAKVASSAPRALKDIATGIGGAAAQGFIMSPEKVEGVPTSIDLVSRVSQAKEAAPYGLIGPAVSISSRGVSKAAKGLSSLSDDMAIKSVGGIQKDFKKLSQKQKKDIAEYIRTSGTFSATDSFEDVLEKSMAKQKEVGAKIGSIVDQFDAGGSTTFSTPDVLKSVVNKMKTSLSDKGFKVGAKQASEGVQDFVDFLSEKPSWSLKDLHELRVELDHLSNMEKLQRVVALGRKSSPSPKEVGIMALRDSLNESVRGRIGTLSGAARSALEDANKEYGRLAKIREMASSGAARSGNRYFGLTDVALGTAGGLYGSSQGDPIEGLAKGIALAGASKAARRYGPGLVSRGAERGGRAFGLLGGAKAPPPGLLGASAVRAKREEK